MVFPFTDFMGKKTIYTPPKEPGRSNRYMPIIRGDCGGGGGGGGGGGVGGSGVYVRVGVCVCVCGGGGVTLSWNWNRVFRFDATDPSIGTYMALAEHVYCNVMLA